MSLDVGSSELWLLTSWRSVPFGNCNLCSMRRGVAAPGLSGVGASAPVHCTLSQERASPKRASCTAQHWHICHRPPFTVVSAAGHPPATRTGRPASPANPGNDRVAWSARGVYAKRKKVKAKRSLGQNFLQRQDVLQSITEAAGVRPGDVVLEIGPGTGALTRHLLRAGALLTAVEKDDALHERLQHEFSQEIQDGSLRLVHGDFLAEDCVALLNAASAMHSSTAASPLASSRKNRKVVANLPYNLTKTILRLLLPLGDHISELYLMIQDEVARRLVAGPDAGLDYRAMNLEVALYSRPTYLFKVDRTAYDPEPNVDGAVVRFELRSRQQYALQDDLKFLGLVRLAFTERRKMLRNTLQSRFLIGDLAEALEAAGVPPNARPQQLALEQYVALWQHLPHQKPAVE